MIGTRLRLEGITLKGKNRIQEHGHMWEVVDTYTKLLLLKSVKTSYLKWGPAPDFEIREIFHSKKGHK